MSRLIDYPEIKIDSSYRNAFITAFFTRSSNMMTGFIDGILTSAFLGVNAMAAYGIAAPYFMMNSIVSYLLVTGVQVLCSTKIGQNRTYEARNISSTALWTLFVLSLLVSALGIVLAEPFARFLGANGDAEYLLSETAGYLRFLFTGNIFHNFVAVSSCALQMDGGAKLIRISGATTLAADVVGDFANIFLFNGGLIGMGAVTAASNVLGAAILIPYFFRRDKLFSLNPKYFRTEYVPQLMKYGYSQSVYGVASFFGNTAINRLILSMAGLNTMFGMTVFKNIVLFINPLCCAVGDATLLLISLRVGECDKDGVNRVFKSSLRMILFLLPCSFILMLFCSPVAHLYVGGHDMQSVLCVRTAIIFLGIQIPFTTLYLTTVKGLQAFKQSAVSSFLNLAKACIFPCGLLLFFADLGNIGVFASLAGAEVLSAIAGTGLFIVEKRKNKFLQIPEENKIQADLFTIEQATEFSTQTVAFCADHGISKKISYRVSLCVEELAICLINYGKENNVNDVKVNINIVSIENKIIMRIRDNCPLNDLRKRAEKWRIDEEHPEKYIGTRMALMISDEFSYVPIMDQNNTVITICI